MSSSRFEVESRAFISSDRFESLRLELEGRLGRIDSVRQVTVYLEHPVDTRVQLEQARGKIWQKSGEMHGSERREIEVNLERDQALKLMEIFQNLGHAPAIFWFRERRSYRDGKFTVCLDKTIGYGLIVEVEIITDAEGIEEAKRDVGRYLRELGVEETPKSIFDSAFAEYQKNWRVATEGLDWQWLEALPGSQ